MGGIGRWCMPRMLVVDPTKCTGCRLCEVACSIKKEGECNPAKSRIQAVVFEEQAFYLPVTCLQCDEAWCATICPAGAISRDPGTGAMLVADDRCVGCKMCLLACPFGTIMYAPHTGKVVKCDLCAGDPECTKFCAPQAIRYAEVGVGELAKRMAVAQRLREAYQGGRSL